MQGPDGEAVWTADQWEDYNAASPRDKQYLLEKWGKPKK
jgi:hypothetical protein